MNRICGYCDHDFQEDGFPDGMVPIDEQAVDDGRIGVLYFCSEACRQSYKHEDGRGDFTIGDASRRAADVVSQERDSHGDAYTNHRQIAALWTAFLDDQLADAIEPWQAAIMMQQVKQSRMQAGQLIADHFVDIAGYSDVALYSAVRDPDVEVSLDGI